MAPACTVSGPGETIDRNARFYGDWMAAHEREHCEEITGIVEALDPVGRAMRQFLAGMAGRLPA
jgi:hypothetical protein